MGQAPHFAGDDVHSDDLLFVRPPGTHVIKQVIRGFGVEETPIRIGSFGRAGKMGVVVLPIAIDELEVIVMLLVEVSCCLRDRNVNAVYSWRIVAVMREILLLAVDFGYKGSLMSA